jgi:hypothetical protein
VLDDRRAGVQQMRERHVVEEQQQFVGAGLQVLVVRGLEAVKRHRDDTTYLFLLNHGESEVSIEIDCDGRSLLDGRDVTRGETLVLAPTDVVIVRS